MTTRRKCVDCLGRGRLSNPRDILGTETCPTCVGTGRVPALSAQTRAFLARVVAYGEIPPGRNRQTLVNRLQLLASDARGLLLAIDGGASDTERG